MPHLLFRLTREYTLEVLDFQLAKTVIAIVYSTVVIYGEYMSRIWNYVEIKTTYENEDLNSCIWFGFLISLYALGDFPFDIYQTYILERHIVQNIKTLKEFLIEQIAKFLLLQVSFLSISAISLIILEYIGSYYFISIWFACSFCLSGFTNLVPIIGYPVSTELIEFPQGELKNKIETICREVDFELEGIHLMISDNDTTDEHNSIYYYGFNTKHIVISVKIVPVAQLQNNLKEDEILALLAHQLGHWYHKHMLKKLIVSQIVLIIWFIVFYYIFEKKILYEAFGFFDKKPVLIGFVISVQYAMMPYNILVSFLLISLSRKFEYEADTFVIALGLKEALKRALICIYKENMQFPVLDDMYSKHNFYQPSILERIHYLNSKF